MKKLFAILLCIAMVLPMVACGSFAEPSAEELEAIDQFCYIMECLQEYEAGSTAFWVSYQRAGAASPDGNGFAQGNAALGVCYVRLKELEAVDKWAGKGYYSDEYDRKKTLKQFAIVEDVLVSRTKRAFDQDGNQSGYDEIDEWMYYADGTLRRAPMDDFPSGGEFWNFRSLASQIPASTGLMKFIGDPFYLYGTGGRIRKIEYKGTANGILRAVGRLTYDQDKLVSEKITDKDGCESTVTYTYDSNGRRTESVTVGYGNKYICAYVYNDKGQLVQETINPPYNESTITYTYDDNGHLASAVSVFLTETSNWTYTCDEAGRPVHIDIHRRNTIIEQTGEEIFTPSEPIIKIDFTYGNYYIYDPLSTHIATVPPQDGANPTDEEWDAIDEFVEIMRALQKYSKTYDPQVLEYFLHWKEFGSNPTFSNRNDVLKLCYERLQALEAVDKWAGKGYYSDEYNRKKTLKQFTVLEDVLVSRTKRTFDQDGNQQGDDIIYEWLYYADGSLRSAYRDSALSNHFGDFWNCRSFASQESLVPANAGLVGTIGSPFYVYGADGEVEKVEYKYSAEAPVEAVGIPTYEQDRIVSEKITYYERETTSHHAHDGNDIIRESTIDYTYDSNGRRTESVTVMEKNKGICTYVYNDNGQLVQETCKSYYEETPGVYVFFEDVTITYTYNDKGHLASAVCVFASIYGSSITSNCTFTCDEAGLPMHIEIHRGNMLNKNGETTLVYSDAVIKIDFTYGDHYIYTPAN